ncbi:MAG TPA: secretin N-terminal domain-containing protein, partial [Gemmataceae bacterium]|nr:secretin N-terminal domain-containing protein [Gemmataceae bacterium]
MHTPTRFTRPVGRWPVAVAIVLAGTLAAGRALPQPPQTSPAPEPAAKPPAEKRVKFEFNNKPWKQVFEWLSDTTGLTFTGYNMPTGSLTFIAPKGSVGATQGYTIPEVIDIINEALLAAPPTQRYQLIRREMSFTLVSAEEKIDPILVPRVTVDELKGRGNTEIVSTVVQLNTLVAEDYAPEVKRMLGPFGEVTVLAKSNQLLLVDSVKSIRNIIKTTDEVEKKEGGHETFTHTCVYIKARDAERTLIAQMGDPRILQAQAMAAAQPRIDPRTGQPLPMTQPAQKIRMFFISADERTNTILVTGPADKTSQAREIMKKIDVPGPAGQKEPELRTFPVASGTAADVSGLLQRMYQNSSIVRISAVGTEKIMVYAPPSDLMDIAKIIEGNSKESASGNIVELLPLNTLDATDAANALKNMFPQDPKTLVGPVIEADTTRNAVRAKGTREQVEDVKMALKAIDAPTAAGAVFTVNMEHGSANQMAIILQKALEARGTPVKVISTAPSPVPGTAPAPAPQTPGANAPGSPMQPTNPPPAVTPGSGNGGGDTPDQNPQQPPANPNAKPVTITAVGNRLIINTDDPQARQYIQEVVRTMTQSGGDGDFEMIKLNNANATDTARVIDEFFNGPKEGNRGGTVLERLRGGGFPGGFPGGMQQQNPSGTTTTPKVRVVADPGSNSLFVRATPLEMVSIRQFAKALDGTDETITAQKVNRIKLKSANVSEVAYVIESLYHDYLGTGARSTTVGGFNGFGFPGGGFGGGGFSGRGSALLRPTDANGNIRPNPLSI